MKLTFLRTMAILEGSSLLILLLIAVPIKYHYGIPEAVRVVGPIHGSLFLAFNLVLWGHVAKGVLTGNQAIKGMIASFIPFGSFIYKATVLKRVVVQANEESLAKP